MDMISKRPKGEIIKPEEITWLDGSEELDKEFSSISAETLVYRVIDENSRNGGISSARMIRESTGLGRTSIRYNLNNLLEKGLVVRKFAVAKTGQSKTILPFYVTKEKEKLLQVEKSKGGKNNK